MNRSEAKMDRQIASKRIGQRPRASSGGQRYPEKTFEINPLSASGAGSFSRLKLHQDDPLYHPTSCPNLMAVARCAGLACLRAFGPPMHSHSGQSRFSDRTLESSFRTPCRSRMNSRHSGGTPRATRLDPGKSGASPCRTRLDLGKSGASPCRTRLDLGKSGASRCRTCFDLRKSGASRCRTRLTWESLARVDAGRVLTWETPAQVDAGRVLTWETLAQVHARHVLRCISRQRTGLSRFSTILPFAHDAPVSSPWGVCRRGDLA